MLLFKQSSVPRIKHLLKLMLPIVASQVAIVGMGFFDTAMSGNYSAVDLAGVAIGSNIWMIAFTAIQGVLMAAMPLIANYLGAGNKLAVTHVVRKGIGLAFIMSALLILAGMIFLPDLLGSIGLEPEVYEVAIWYLVAIGAGIPVFFVDALLRAFIDTLGFTQKSMKIYLAALPINGVINYCFIFGAWGLPAYGGVGAGIATAITCWILLVVFLYNICCVTPFKEYKIFGGLTNQSGDDNVTYYEYLKMGIPLGLSVMLETSVFCVTALFVAKFGTVALAAHQSAVNFSALIYMIPFAFSMASTIIIGVEYGAKRFLSLKIYTRLVLEMSSCLGILYIAAELLTYNYIAELYSNDPEVVSLTGTLILFACVWQLGDMVCAPCQGITRGLKDVNATLISAAIAYWAICLPMGLILDYGFDMGIFSYWISLDVGVIVSALAMLVRLRSDMKGIPALSWTEE